MAETNTAPSVDHQTLEHSKGADEEFSQFLKNGVWSNLLNLDTAHSEFTFT